MKRKIHTAEQIVNKLRQADEFMAKGGTLEDVARQLGISSATYYNWRRQYGQMKLDQVRHLRMLEKENTQLKKLVADLSLDNAVLKETIRGNF